MERLVNRRASTGGGPRRLSKAVLPLASHQNRNRKSSAARRSGCHAAAFVIGGFRVSNAA
jgi:hypothetical protein